MNGTIESGEIEELKRQRGELEFGENREYSRLSARIRYLRSGVDVRKKAAEWRKKNSSRMAYENLVSGKVQKRVFTDEQRKKMNEATYRCDQKNPQRRMRRLFDKNVQNYCKSIRLGEVPSHALKENHWSPTERLLGCRFLEFKEHLEELCSVYGFKVRDYGETWTLDHVVPVCRFTLPAEAWACWHYTNLRPWPKGKNNRRAMKRWIR